MIPHEDMTLGQRIVLTLVICLIILFAFAVAGWISGRWDEAPAAPLVFDHTPFDQRLAELEHEAVEDAFRARVHLLFTNWMNEPQHDQPRRALTGIATARSIYAQAMTEIQKREKR